MASSPEVGSAASEYPWSLEHRPLRYQHRMQRAELLEQWREESKSTSSSSRAPGVQEQEETLRGLPLSRMGDLSSSSSSVPQMRQADPMPGPSGTALSSASINEELSYFRGVLRGEEHRWQQDSRVREELQSEFAGLKDAMQREAQWRENAEHAEAQSLRLLFRAEALANEEAAHLQRKREEEIKSADWHNEEQKLCQECAAWDIAEAEAASSLRKEEELVTMLRAEAQAVTGEAEKATLTQSAAYNRDIDVTRTSLEEELAARESCLRAGEAMHRHLEDACSKVSEAYQTELRAAATEHEIELGKRRNLVQEVRKEIITRGSRPTMLRELEANVIALREQARALEMSYASELQAVHEASLMYREQLQEEYASKTEMVREASIKVEVLKGKEHKAIPSLEGTSKRGLQQLFVESKWHRFVLTIITNPFSYQHKRCQRLWAPAARRLQDKSRELSAAVAEIKRRGDPETLEELSVLLEKADMQHTEVETSHIEHTKLAKITTEVLMAEVQKTIKLWRQQVEAFQLALSVEEGNRSQAEEDLREAERRGAELRFDLELEKAAVEGDAHEHQAKAVILEAEVREERWEAVAMAKALQEAETAVAVLVDQHVGNVSEKRAGSVFQSA